ncbi:MULTISPECIES: transcription elongation factor GreA [Rothia]|uniref:Transcription elongation factor GreA n=1 Tax=Rothia kristinae TaxID=37923 RepID=A0A0Q2URS0_9MICC|nr:transcription elongation factor GreA [Rothia kristinae]MBE8528124.1 transcription elongation factor GreA [Amycolatopsis sp. H6(2020)]MDN5640432.1 transcription elongation factor GreA [Actinomycetes bacterium]TDP56083.1 transcription elongation factor GreA [Kocuria sp. AG109]SIL92715.1 transcription elongation factor GreA [Mycobacteroides abscessus subsp. abscessus]KTR40913.1 transcription elongation factor GreA [Rothia kristinae]
MSEETTESAAWLTQEAYDRLQAELEEREGPKRQEIVDRIEAAREEGDLRENGGYHAAKEEQGKNEGRIQQLKYLLENSEVGQKPADDGVVEPGMRVEAEIAGKKITFLLGSREVADTLVGDDDLQVYSEKSPMGQAIMGHKVGDELTYQAPNGKDIPLKVLAAKPY